MLGNQVKNISLCPREWIDKKKNGRLEGGWGRGQQRRDKCTRHGRVCFSRLVGKIICRTQSSQRRARILGRIKAHLVQLWSQKAAWLLERIFATVNLSLDKGDKEAMPIA